MADNKDSNTSFLSEGKKQEIHIKDILFTLLRNIPWLLICGAVGTFIAGYYVRHQDRIYESSARVLIKAPPPAATTKAPSVKLPSKACSPPARSTTAPSTTR